MTDWYNGYTLIGTKIHKIRMIDDYFKTMCGRYVDTNVMGVVDMKRIKPKELCKYCYGSPKIEKM